MKLLSRKVKESIEERAELLLVPELNLELYERLYIIEVGLRELIIETLEKVSPKWTKQRVAKDLKDKFADGTKYERNAKWIRWIPHHPIYYLDFADLAKIILQNNNWDEVFKTMFSNNKELVASTLKELEAPRNKIAHNRKATQADATLVTGAYSKIASMISEERLILLAQRCTFSEDLPHRLKGLEEEARLSYKLFEGLKTIKSLESWNDVKHAWWFDSNFLGVGLEPIEDYFKMLEEYMALPRRRGSGALIEAWVRDSKRESKFNEATNIFNALEREGIK